MIKRYATWLSLALLITTTASAMDNFHFYRPPFWGISFGEPRLVEPNLTSLDIAFGGGSTKKARGGCCNSTTGLLNLHGPYNMHLLGSNVPGKDPRTQEDIALIELARTVGRDCLFGHLEYCGKFKLFETQLLLTQNFRHGLFTQIGLPIRHMSLSKVCSVDITPQTCPCPDVDTHTWQTFLSLYNKILDRYDICAGGFDKTNIGDLSWLIGWGCNYQDMRVLDYVDLDVKIGMIFPTGKKQNVDSAFDIPFGYNGHLGVGASYDVAVGVYNWLTFGGYGGAIVFADKTREIRMQTDSEQNGFIKLAKGCANIDKGTIWYAGAFGKLDHIAAGFSVLCGYTYCAQQKDLLLPENTNFFDPSAANCDATLQGWDMHTIHLLADYDCASEEHNFSPRVGFFANITMGGEHIFRTHMAGGTFGFDISYEF
jgi:hypothetical protein